MDTQSWKTSWTLWANAIAVVLGVLSTEDLGLPPSALKYIVIAAAIVNALLRVLKTDKPIGGSPTNKPQ